MKYNLKKYLICCISETNKFTLQKNFYNKIWYTHVYIQIWDYYSAMKTNEILPFVANMDGAGSYNSKLNKKEKVSMISLIC